MKALTIILFLLVAAVASIARAQQNATGENVQVRAGIRHDAFDALLKKYVNEQGLVEYNGWKENAADLSALDEYLKQFAPAASPAASGNERAASLVNAYNGFVLQWILKNYPTESIWQLKNSFKAKRNAVGGGMYSLNDIENGALRPAIGWRAHAVLVCAARSCPPLQRAAYTAENFAEQNAGAFRAWLARDDLNRFLPGQKRVEISSIFKWFSGDFDQVGGVAKVLGMYAPENVRAFAGSGEYETRYLSYNWGLNDQGAHGRHYSKANLIFDFLK
ncbi:MAG: DUF547 domain-containing protein [Verrucomicrobia bacterium]|nr:DUF547 domain-containing protein [Verrucomicrobiota bacterium]